MATAGDESEKPAAASRVQAAVDSAKDFAAKADLDALRAKAADTASVIYHQGREILNSGELARATDQLSESIRKNPLAAVGMAFTAGVVFALLTRG
jgi:ElaB/YqjD/DUF883 family membrane-anchored ribosome-binding protein